MQDNGLSDTTETSSGASSTSTAFLDRMSNRMNRIPSLLEPLGAIPDLRGGEQQEVDINPDLSVHAEDDADNDASVVAAIIGDGAAGVVEDGAAGVVEDVLGQATEDTAPPILATPPSNSGGSRKRGVATTARATTSLSKKKKVAAQCRKGVCV